MVNKADIEKIDQIRKQIESKNIDSATDAEALRIKYLGGNQGIVINLYDQICSEVPPKKRRKVAKQIDDLRQRVEKRIEPFLT